MYKEILMKHVQNLKEIMVNHSIVRINDCTQKCCMNRCIKSSSYKYHNNYYCWFHRIDLDINNKLIY